MAATTQVAVAAALCLFAVACRFWIDVPNFQPMMAVAMLAATWIRDWRWAVMVPALSLVLSDLWFGSYELPVMIAVYGCMVSPVLWVRMTDRSPARNPLLRLLNWNLGGVSAALLFFIVTNFVCWAATPWYPPTWAGLMSCYWAAIPFLRWMVLGNLFFVTTLGGSSLLIQHCHQAFRPGQALVPGQPSA